VRAKILDGGNAPFMATIENDFLTAYLPPQRLGSDLVRGAGDIPGVFRIHRVLRDRLVFMDPFDRINLIFVKLFTVLTTLMDPLKPKHRYSTFEHLRHAKSVLTTWMTLLKPTASTPASIIDSLLTNCRGQA
jgi:hypothetical protein